MCRLATIEYDCCDEYKSLNPSKKETTITRHCTTPNYKGPSCADGDTFPMEVERDKPSGRISVPDGGCRSCRRRRWMGDWLHAHGWMVVAVESEQKGLGWALEDNEYAWFRLPAVKMKIWREARRFARAMSKELEREGQVPGPTYAMLEGDPVEFSWGFPSLALWLYGLRWSGTNDPPLWMYQDGRRITLYEGSQDFDC